MRAQSVEACSCAHGCNCQFGGTPNEGICEFIIGYVVDEGRYGNVDLAGFRAVVAAKYPNAIHEGHGHVALFVDQKASKEQVEAFATILSGQAGGMPWEALAGTIEKFEGPIAKPIDISIAGQRAHVPGPGRARAGDDPVPRRGNRRGEGGAHHLSQGRLLLERRERGDHQHDAGGPRIPAYVVARQVRGDRRGELDQRGLKRGWKLFRHWND